jgi:hypothetical protein
VILTNGVTQVRIETKGLVARHEIEMIAQSVFQYEETTPLRTKGRLMNMIEALHQDQIIQTVTAEAPPRMTVKEGIQEWTYAAQSLRDLRQQLERDRGLEPGQYQILNEGWREVDLKSIEYVWMVRNWGTQMKRIDPHTPPTKGAAEKAHKKMLREWDPETQGSYETLSRIRKKTKTYQETHDFEDIRVGDRKCRIAIPNRSVKIVKRALMGDLGIDETDMRIKVDKWGCDEGLVPRGEIEV